MYSHIGILLDIFHETESKIEKQQGLNLAFSRIMTGQKKKTPKKTENQNLA